MYVTKIQSQERYFTLPIATSKLLREKLSNRSYKTGVAACNNLISLPCNNEKYKIFLNLYFCFHSRFKMNIFVILGVSTL